MCDHSRKRFSEYEEHAVPSLPSCVHDVARDLRIRAVGAIGRAGLELVGELYPLCSFRSIQIKGDDASHFLSKQSEAWDDLESAINMHDRLGDDDDEYVHAVLAEDILGELGVLLQCNGALSYIRRHVSAVNIMKWWRAVVPLNAQVRHVAHDIMVLVNGIDDSIAEGIVEELSFTSQLHIIWSQGSTLRSMIDPSKKGVWV